MSERDRLIREALDATVRGDRHRALQIYTRLLMADRSDEDAREGLRRLGVPVPGEEMLDDQFWEPLQEELRRPAPPPKPARTRGMDPVYRVQPEPDYRTRASRERWALILALLAVLAILMALMTPACSRLGVPLPTFTASSYTLWKAGPEAVQPNLQATLERPAMPASCRCELDPKTLPPDLLESGRREATPEGTKWSIKAAEGQSEAYQASVAGDVLRSDRSLAEAEVGAVKASREGDSIQIAGTDAAKLTEENWLILTSAVWRFTEKHGKFPEALTDVVPGYIDSIPLEAVTGKASAVSKPDGRGGWAYSPPAGGGSIWDGIAAAVRPNLPEGQLSLPATFTPISVAADKSDGRIEVKSGDRVLRSYPMGIGANNMTPEGTFGIDFRSALAESLPDGSPNPFGTRWLRLTVQAEAGAFGIHGFDNPKAVLEPTSLGCLRLRRGDLEDFYRLVPTGTPVTIRP